VTEARRSNIEIVFADWLDAIRRGDIELMERTLAPDVVHQGIRPEWTCDGREAVLENARARSDALPSVDALELVAAGDNVVMSIRAREVGPPVDEEGDRLRGQAFVVFTLRDGVIVAMQDYLRRADALAAAGADGSWL
jgi:ketosteroid isomerase-like protein